MACYVMVGFDSAGELSEETHAPRRITARTIIRALVVSGVGGALLLFGALLAAPSLTDGHLATVGLPWVLTSVMGPVGGVSCWSMSRSRSASVPSRARHPAPA